MHLGVGRIRTQFKYDTLKYIVNCNNQEIGSLVKNLACLVLKIALASEFR